MRPHAPRKGGPAPRTTAETPAHQRSLTRARTRLGCPLFSGTEVPDGEAPDDSEKDTLLYTFISNVDPANDVAITLDSRPVPVGAFLSFVYGWARRLRSLGPFSFVTWLASDGAAGNPHLHGVLRTDLRPHDLGIRLDLGDEGGGQRCRVRRQTLLTNLEEGRPVVPLVLNEISYRRCSRS